MEFFTQQHFDLLHQWSEKKYDNQNIEHKAAYKELADVYKLVHQWANRIQQEVFPNGRVSVIKKPTNQAQIFESYLWGKYILKKTLLKNSPIQLDLTLKG